KRYFRHTGRALFWGGSESRSFPARPRRKCSQGEPWQSPASVHAIASLDPWIISPTGSVTRTDRKQIISGSRIASPFPLHSPDLKLGISYFECTVAARGLQAALWRHPYSAVES